MSTVASSLTTWEEFVELPDPEDAVRYELHDGEVVAVPTPKPIHVYIQNLLMRLLTTLAQGRGYADRNSRTGRLRTCSIGTPM